MKKIACRQYSVARSHAPAALAESPPAALSFAAASARSASADHAVNQLSLSPGVTFAAATSISPRSADCA